MTIATTGSARVLWGDVCRAGTFGLETSVREVGWLGLGLSNLELRFLHNVSRGYSMQI